MDGRSHPLNEANEGKRREQRLNTALNDLKNIYEHGDAFGTYDTVKKLRTAIAKRRDAQSFKANLCQPFLIPNGCDDYFPTDTRHLQRPSKKARACKSILSQPVTRDGNGTRGGESVTERPLNYFEAAMPIRYFELGLDKVGLLMDGKDCVTDTVRVNSFISSSQYSDKMHCSAARYIMWVLPCGLSVTYTPVFLGRTSEKALVEYWGGRKYLQSVTYLIIQ
mmetsp:Transcript_24054/g.47786  ORF Transcript_24054/g.47786 Transcript_24054/m.47786 type:complete len:222 (+) Transcript_24054:1633-2298(+)